MDGYSQAVILYTLILLGFGSYGLWELRQMRRLDAKIRRIEDEQARQAAARACAAE